MVDEYCGNYCAIKEVFGVSFRDEFKNMQQDITIATVTQ